MKYKFLFILFSVFLVGSCGENVPPVESSYETKILYLGNLDANRDWGHA